MAALQYSRRLLANLNRGLKFQAASFQYADLIVPGTGTALTGTSWEVEMRIRWDTNNGQSYILNRGLDEFAVLFNYNVGGIPGVYEILSSQNSLGATIRLTMTTAVALGQWAVIKFTYDGTTLRAFLDGAPTGTLVSTFTLNGASGGALRLGSRTDGIRPSSNTIDYLKMTRGGVVIVNHQFLEAAAPFVNSGSSGGSITTTNGTVVIIS
jgi:hypothetical protein